MGKSKLHIEWESRLKEFETSNQKLTTWCRQNGISIHQAKYWRRKLQVDEQTASQSPQWVAVRMMGSDMSRQDASLLVKVGPVAIEIQPGYNAELLKDVIRTLNTIC